MSCFGSLLGTRRGHLGRRRNPAVVAAAAAVVVVGMMCLIGSLSRDRSRRFVVDSICRDIF